jgi:hypothetical protein
MAAHNFEKSWNHGWLDVAATHLGWSITPTLTAFLPLHDVTGEITRTPVGVHSSPTYSLSHTSENGRPTAATSAASRAPYRKVSRGIVA